MVNRTCERFAELLAALDEQIPIPEREVDKPFLMSVEDVFSIKGRGTVVTGRVDRGTMVPTLLKTRNIVFVLPLSY